MSPMELIAFFMEEAHNHVIVEDCANQAELTLYACIQGRKPSKPNESNDSELDLDLDLDLDSDDSELSSSSVSSNKEEDKPSQKSKSSTRETKPVRLAGVVVVEELYALTCTLDISATTEPLKVPRSNLNIFVDS